MPSFKILFSPNRALNRTTFLALCGIQAVTALVVWSFAVSPVIPRPAGVFKAWVGLLHGDFMTELITSSVLALESVLLTFVISLAVSYAAVLPFFRPLGEFVSKLRFLSLVGLSFVFLLMVDGGHSLKVSLLVFCMVVFFVTSMMSEISGITRN